MENHTTVHQPQNDRTNTAGGEYIEFEPIGDERMDLNYQPGEVVVWEVQQPSVVIESIPVFEPQYKEPAIDLDILLELAGDVIGWVFWLVGQILVGGVMLIFGLLNALACSMFSTRADPMDREFPIDTNRRRRGGRKITIINNFNSSGDDDITIINNF